MKSKGSVLSTTGMEKVNWTCITSGTSCTPWAWTSWNPSVSSTVNKTIPKRNSASLTRSSNSSTSASKSPTTPATIMTTLNCANFTTRMRMAQSWLQNWRLFCHWWVNIIYKYSTYITHVNLVILELKTFSAKLYSIPKFHYFQQSKFQAQFKEQLNFLHIP